MASDRPPMNVLLVAEESAGAHALRLLLGRGEQVAGVLTGESSDHGARLRPSPRSMAWRSTTRTACGMPRSPAG